MPADADAPRLDIRARIAALELNRDGGRPRSASAASGDAGRVTSPARRTAVTVGADPLSSRNEDGLDAFVPLTPSRSPLSTRSSSPAPSTASTWTHVSQPPAMPPRPSVATRAPSLGSGSLITLDSPQEGASPWVAVPSASPQPNGKSAPALPPRKPTLPVAAAAGGLPAGGSPAQRRYDQLFDGLPERYRTDGRLRPAVVEALWSRSKLPAERLASIWYVSHRRGPF